jgi:Family of unknown function (DUF5320)
MPRGDRTGPMGMGARSGRAAGRCAGFDAPGYASLGLERGRGMGFGRGGGGWGRGFGGRWRGFAWGGPPARTPWDAASGLDAATERQVLKRHADTLRMQLREIDSRLAGSEVKKETPE